MNLRWIDRINSTESRSDSSEGILKVQGQSRITIILKHLRAATRKKKTDNSRASRIGKFRMRSGKLC